MYNDSFSYAGKKRGNRDRSKVGEFFWVRNLRNTCDNCSFPKCGRFAKSESKVQDISNNRCEFNSKVLEQPVGRVIRSRWSLRPTDCRERFENLVFKNLTGREVLLCLRVNFTRNKGNNIIDNSFIISYVSGNGSEVCSKVFWSEGASRKTITFAWSCVGANWRPELLNVLMGDFREVWRSLVSEISLPILTDKDRASAILPFLMSLFLFRKRDFVSGVMYVGVLSVIVK